MDREHVYEDENAGEELIQLPPNFVPYQPQPEEDMAESLTIEQSERLLEALGMVKKPRNCGKCAYCKDPTEGVAASVLCLKKAPIREDDVITRFPFGNIVLAGAAEYCGYYMALE